MQTTLIHAGQQVADRHRMQHRGDHQAEVDVFDPGPHLGLGLEHVGDHVRQRAVVADAAGEQELDIVLDAGVHDARLQHPLLDRRGESSRSGGCD